MGTEVRSPGKAEPTKLERKIIVVWPNGTVSKVR